MRLLLAAARRRTRLASGGGTYLVSEDAEGTGTPSGWTQSGNVDWDYTTTVLAGTQSLQLITNGGSAGNMVQTPSFAAQSALYVYFVMRVTENAWKTDGNARICSLRSGSSEEAAVPLSNARVPSVLHGSASAAASSALTLNTTYHIWVEYVAGTGANGQMLLYISSNGTKPGSPTVTLTTGTSTASIDSVQFGRAIAGNASLIFDTMRVASTVIGDNGSLS